MAEKRPSADIKTKGIADLLSQHVAIRSQMRFLINGLNDISVPSDEEITPSMVLNEQISLYRYLLDDFQEAMKRHNDLYERIEILCGRIFNKEIMIEKKEIEKQLDNIVQAAHTVIYHGSQRDDLNRYVSDIVEGVNRICESIEIHMSKEERVLE